MPEQCTACAMCAMYFPLHMSSEGYIGEGWDPGTRPQPTCGGCTFEK